MSPTEIIRIPVLPLKTVNAHLIRSEAGCILVDAGIPGSERRIARALARLGLSFPDIKLIVVTTPTPITREAPSACAICRGRRYWRMPTMRIFTAERSR